jgi:hypothetical protein
LQNEGDKIASGTVFEVFDKDKLKSLKKIIHKKERRVLHVKAFGRMLEMKKR